MFLQARRFHKLTAECAGRPAEWKSCARGLLFRYGSHRRRGQGHCGYAANGDLFELTPEREYSSGDLNWNDEFSRVNGEHNDESLRDVPLNVTSPDGWDKYDTVFIGYPIWWGGAVWPVNHFVTDNDFTGEKVIPFATSASSPLGSSGSDLADMAGAGDWQDGQRFSSSVSADEVTSWVEGLGL